MVFVALFVASFAIMGLIRVGQDDVGREVTSLWLSERASCTGCDVNIDSVNMVLRQATALTFFLLVVIGSVIRMEWRVGLAILGLVTVVFTGVVPPEVLVSRSVEWNLILFLIGSMTFTGLLRQLGVFRYIAVNIVRATRGSPILLLLLLLSLSFVLAAAVDEVTSIVYIAALVFELASVMNVDSRPLLVLAVLATNTGSLALPIGNPIGVYLFFKAGLPMATYVRYSATLALLCLAVLLLLVPLIERGLIESMGKGLSKRARRVEAFVRHYYAELEDRTLVGLRHGLVMFLGFIAMVALNDHVASLLGRAFGESVDPHSLLAFIPYVFIVLSITTVRVEDIPKHLGRSVDWPSLMFFICLFILSYSLTYSGAMVKLAYALLQGVHSTLPILLLMVLSPALLSAVLDNLSVIVAFTPIATLMERIGATSYLVYFSLLYGGVLGGNYTPIGSTANIIAVSMAERKKVKIGWGMWLRIALILTTAQTAVALAWLYLCYTLRF